MVRGTSEDQVEGIQDDVGDHAAQTKQSMMRERARRDEVAEDSERRATVRGAQEVRRQKHEGRKKAANDKGHRGKEDASQRRMMEYRMRYEKLMKLKSNVEALEQEMRANNRMASRAVQSARREEMERDAEERAGMCKAQESKWQMVAAMVRPLPDVKGQRRTVQLLRTESAEKMRRTLSGL